LNQVLIEKKELRLEKRILADIQGAGSNSLNIGLFANISPRLMDLAPCRDVTILGFDHVKRNMGESWQRAGQT
jgi:hypothetical protein